MIGNYLQLSAEQLEAIIDEPAEAENLAYPESEDFPSNALDIDKSWHLIHFLLAGEAWGGDGPLANVVLGGLELTGTDAGYGPFRYLTPAQVREASQALAGVSAQELWARFDATQVEAAEIYPTQWRGDDEEREYVSQNYDSLRRYFAEAATSGRAMLLYLS
jgi:hypothetical protein